MKIEDVKIKVYVANDGTEFYSQKECEEYEKSLEPFVVKPEWIERHEKQVAEKVEKREKEITKVITKDISEEDKATFKKVLEQMQKNCSDLLKQNEN